MYYFIVNPHAGNGKALQIFEKLQKTDLYQSIDAVYQFTEYEGHAEDIAAKLKNNDQIERLIVVGGDGTIHETINGLGPSDIIIGFIPGGSGNDFSRGVGIKGTPEDILRLTIAGESTMTYWLGQYEHDNELKRYFVNSLGFGFDAKTAHTANQSFYKGFFNRLGLSTLSYVIAVLQILAGYKNMDLELTIDGEKKRIRQGFLISLGNHPYYGGGMKMMPNATLQPNKFAVLLVHSVSKWKVLALFLSVFQGKHSKINGVELFEAEEVVILSKEPIYMQVDGQTKKCQTAKITKPAQAVKVITSK